MNSNPTNTQHASADTRALTLTRAYSVGELAAALDTGRRPLYRAIRAGRLRAAQLNDRGDLRVLGAWALDYLEAQSGKASDATA
jgi:hypothetical protein